MRSFRLKFDLARRILLEESGFDGGVTADGNRQIVRSRFDVGEYRFYLTGRCYSFRDVAEIRRWLARFRPAELSAWARGLDGDFSLIVFDENHQRAWLVGDRNGASRVYYSNQGGRLSFSSSHLDQIRLLESPRISSFAAFQLLTTKFVLDPYSLIEEVRVSQPGEIITFSPFSSQSCNYYDPVPLDGSYYRTEQECISALDEAFQQVFEKLISPTRTPCVLLSGGIDSVCMLRYLSKLAPGQVLTLTFSFKGMYPNELEPSLIAARHFGSEHHELIIEPREMGKMYIRMLLTSDSPNYACIMHLAERAYLEGLGGDYDIFSGEDTRLHTPTFDYPRELGIFVNRDISHASPVFRRAAAAAARSLELWPFYPKGYLRYWAKNLYPKVDFKTHIVQSLLSLSVPEGCSLDSQNFQSFVATVPDFSPSDSFQVIFKKLVAFEYRWQYTDDMQAGTHSATGPTTELQMPFYDWQCVEVCNRIPYHLGMRPMLTLRSWSRIPLVRKRILRKVLEGSVPRSVLYRAKATCPCSDLLFNGALLPIVRLIVALWVPNLLQSVDQEVREIITTYVHAFSSKSEFTRSDDPLLWSILAITHLATLNQVCLYPSLHLEEELERIYELAQFGSARANGEKFAIR